MRKEVRVVPMKRDIMKIPSLASKPTVTWTEENATKSTTTAHFGEQTLTVKKMAAVLYALISGAHKECTNFMKNVVNSGNIQKWAILSQTKLVTV